MSKNNKNKNTAQKPEVIETPVNETVENNEPVTVQDVISKAVENQTAEVENTEEVKTEVETVPTESTDSIESVVAEATPSVENKESHIVEEEDVPMDGEGYYLKITTPKDFAFIKERLSKSNIVAHHDGNKVFAGPFKSTLDMMIAKKRIISRGFKCLIIQK